MFKSKCFQKKDKKLLKCMICLEYKHSNIVSCTKCKSGYVCYNCIKQNYLINKKQLLKCQQCGTYSSKLVYNDYSPYLNKIIIILIKILYSLYLSFNIINIINSKNNIFIMSLSFMKIYILLHIINFLIIDFHNYKFSKNLWTKKTLLEDVNYYSTIVVINYYSYSCSYNNETINNNKNISFLVKLYNKLIFLAINTATVLISFYIKFKKQKNRINSAILSRRI